MRFIALITCFLLVNAGVKAQAAFTNEQEFEAQYQINIKKTHLDKIYIPKDLEDAFVEIINLTDKDDLAKFALQDEESVAQKLHFGLGRWMMINWKFYTGSRFSHYLKGLGLLTPDHKAQFVIRSLHRNLNGQPLDTGDLVEEYRVIRMNEIEALKSKQTIIKEETRKIEKQGQ